MHIGMTGKIVTQDSTILALPIILNYTSQDTILYYANTSIYILILVYPGIANKPCRKYEILPVGAGSAQDTVSTVSALSSVMDRHFRTVVPCAAPVLVPQVCTIPAWREVYAVAANPKTCWGLKQKLHIR
jgi:hypothetical protein